MNTFRTDVSVSPSTSKIGLKNLILTAGSCFADAIGTRLKTLKFLTSVNVFGSIYNPVSIHRSLLYGVLNKCANADSFLTNHEMTLNYDFHSSCSAPNQEMLELELNTSIAHVHTFLHDASVVIITYGTTWVYERKDTGEIVANCHKMPASNFKKRLLSEKEILNSFESFYAALKNFNPHVRIILTVSPVRHIKDTLELNSVSKAILRMACHTLAANFPDVEYFPAYEIMMDDLRDYRFYKSDMIHPTADAEDYIFEKFSDRYFDAGTKDFVLKWSALVAAMKHKAFHPASSSHQKFLKDTLTKIQSFKDVIDVTEETACIRSQIL